MSRFLWFTVYKCVRSCDGLS